MDKTDYSYMAETICTALCSNPGLLARMNNELRKMVTAVDDPDSDAGEVWSPEQRTQIQAFINESANMVSEIVNGNKL